MASPRVRWFLVNLSYSGLALFSKPTSFGTVTRLNYSGNLPPIETIDKCGGVLTETKPYADGKPMNVYWIVLC